MNELRIDPSTILRNSARGMRNAWTLTPSAFSATSDASTFLSSIVTSTRSMSDFAQTVSCDRLPHRMAARMERSPLHLLDERVEGCDELLVNRLLLHAARASEVARKVYPNLSG